MKYSLKTQKLLAFSESESLPSKQEREWGQNEWLNELVYGGADGGKERYIWLRRKAMTKLWSLVNATGKGNF